MTRGRPLYSVLKRKNDIFSFNHSLPSLIFSKLLENFLIGRINTENTVSILLQLFATFSSLRESFLRFFKKGIFKKIFQAKYLRKFYSNIQKMRKYFQKSPMTFKKQRSSRYGWLGQVRLEVGKLSILGRWYRTFPRSGGPTGDTKWLLKS